MTTFDNKNTWVFDLDNTLYPAECDLFSQVSDKMNIFIQDYLKIDLNAAKTIRRDYYLKYGTTLAGLMEVNGLQPDAFLDFVHDIDHSVLTENKPLRAAIDRLPGRKLIYTNGSTGHAEGVAGKIGILDLFDGIFDIKASNYIPKPRTEAFNMFLLHHDVEPKSAAMFEDLPHNLEPAHALGMTTVLVHSTYDDHPSQNDVKDGKPLPSYIHHRTKDLTQFLSELT